MRLKRLIVCLLLILFINIEASSQTDSVFATYTTAINRSNLYTKLVNQINKNLSIPLTPKTESKWQDVMWPMELTIYKTPWIKTRIKYAFDSIQYRSTNFQRDLLELAYTNYPKDFVKEVNGFISQISNPKVFAMAAEYLLQKKAITRQYLF